jgi:RNA polymerase sigma-70 factor (ECF subfamily)
MADGDIDALANEDDATDGFYLTNRDELVKYALSITGNRQDAEDAVHEAATRSYEYYLVHGRMCPPDRDPVAYMKVTIRNYIIDKYRRGRVEERRLQALIPRHQEDIADEVERRIMLEQVFSAMRQLRTDAYQIAVMYWAKGMKDEEIAAELSISASTVRSSISRTRKKLRKWLDLED